MSVDAEAMSAEELRKWRKGHGLTQKSAAGFVGYSLRQYQRFEEGDAVIPARLAKYVRLAFVPKAR